MYKLFTFCFLLTLFLTNCHSPATITSNTKKIVTFKGKIDHATQNKLTLSTPYDQMIVAVKGGVFKVELPLEVAVVAEFQYFKNSWNAYGRPGETIEITFKEGDFDATYKVSKYEAENKFIKELASQLQKPQENFSALFGQNEQAFLKTLDSLNLMGISSVLRFVKDHPTTDGAMKEWLNAMVIYASGENLELYPNVHQMVTKDTTYKRSAAYLTIQQKLKKERPELIAHPNYAAFLKARLSNLAGKEWEKMPAKGRKYSDYLKAEMTTIEKHFENPILKETMTFGALKRQLLYSGVNGVSEYLTPFLTNSKSAFYKREIQELYDKWAHLEVGKTAPNFTYPDLQKTLHSLSDYKGKYVYIDVWATWCGPCLAEQPALAEIEEHYKDNPNIVFMGVSTDQNKQAWENMVRDRKLKGVQLLAEGNNQSIISQQYNISGIPRFILVDKAGNIIDANAERPSSEGLKNQLAELLD